MSGTNAEIPGGGGGWGGLGWIDRIWLLHRILEPTRLTTLLIAGTCGLLVFAPQGRDVLISALDEAGSTRVALFASALLLATMTWYTTRALLYVRYGREIPATSGSAQAAPSWRPRVPIELPVSGRVRIWWPRILGALPLLALAGALFAADRRGAGVGAGALAAAFVALAHQRRRWLGLAAVPGQSDRLPRQTAWVVLACLLLNAVCFITFARSHVVFPRWVGTGPILFTAVSGWVVIANIFVVYPAYRFGYSTALPLLATAGFALFLHVDNHALRESPVPVPIVERPTLQTHFDAWIAKRREWGLRTSDGKLPVFVVATEGGGIRAAYWTASVLAELERVYPGFSCQTFVISGVSGGNVGAVVHSALLADAYESGLWVCDGGPRPPIDLATPAQAVLGQDFLAPLVAGMLTSDLVQRIWPWPRFADRATYLEHSFEDAYARATASIGMGSERLSEDFLSLWTKEEPAEPIGARGASPWDGASPVPSLFLNTTWVETGARAVISNLVFRNTDYGIENGGTGPFYALEDVLARLGRSVPASTAAHGGARFPYLSPGGSIRDERGRFVSQIVDGGYFENSGALTAVEIVTGLRERCPGECAFVPIVISNAPDHPANDGPTRPPRAAGESLLPIQTFMRTRSARGRHAELRFGRAEGTPCTIELRLTRGSRNPPLGWMLAEGSRERMRAASIEVVKGLGGTCLNGMFARR
jgi:hypothetical protein